MKQLLLLLSGLAFAAAGAADKDYRFTLQEPASLNGTQLKPGNCSARIEGDKAIVTCGKTEAEAPAKIETGDHKYPYTMTEFASDNNNLRLTYIDIGGTKNRIAFTTSATTGQ